MLIMITELIQRRVIKLIKIFNHQIASCHVKLMTNLGESTDLKFFFVRSLSDDHTLYPQPYASMVSTHNPMRAGMASTVMGGNDRLRNGKLHRRQNDNITIPKISLISNTPLKHSIVEELQCSLQIQKYEALALPISFI